MHDNNSSIKPTVFDGTWGMLGGGASYGTFDMSLGVLRLGDAYSDSTQNIHGGGVGVGGTFGLSHLSADTKWTSCKCP